MLSGFDHKRGKMENGSAPLPPKVRPLPPRRSRLANGNPRWTQSSAAQQSLPGGDGPPYPAPPSNLLSLPDNKLMDLMTLLDRNCVKFGFIPNGATLASTNSRLDFLYRNACVDNLVPHIELTRTEFERLLSRHPRANVLSLTWLQVSELAASVNLPLHTLIVNNDTKLTFSTKPESHVSKRGGEQLRSLMGLLERNPDLKELRCRFAPNHRLHMESQRNMLAAIPPQLKVFSICSIQIDDAACAKLVKQLHGLEELGLESRPGIAQLTQTFDAIATLPKLKTLFLCRTNFSDVDAARILPRMQTLEHLVVHHCHSLTAGLWNAFPSEFALTRLDANDTNISADVPNGQRGLNALRELTVSSPTNGEGLTDWAALVHKFGMLRVLSLSGSGNLGDAHVHDALQSMPHLENLNLNGCRAIGGPTFDAIGALPALTELHLERTAFSDADAARYFPHMRALRVLKVTGCQQIGSALWETLPPSLRDLYAEYTALLERNAGNGNRAGWLRLLHATTPPGDAAAPRRVTRSWVNGWAALPGGLDELRVLKLGGLQVGDSGMGEALGRMPRLESLILIDCGVTPVPAAEAITGHPRLERAELWGEVDEDAERLFRSWERAHWTGNRQVTWIGKM